MNCSLLYFLLLTYLLACIEFVALHQIEQYHYLQLFFSVYLNIVSAHFNSGTAHSERNRKETVQDKE